jgi:hypothetical protein
MWKFVKKLIRISNMCAQTKDHAIGHMVYYNQYSQFLKVMIIYFYELHHRFPMFQVL